MSALANYRFASANNLVLAITLFVTSVVSHAQSDHPLHQGFFTAEQAMNGEAVYMANCASCHASDLRGNSNSPGLVGMGFLFLWEERPLAELFTKMREEMPTDRPGSLSTNSYLDLLAFILQKNGYPAGDNPLIVESLTSSDIAIIPPP